MKQKRKVNIINKIFLLIITFFFINVISNNILSKSIATEITTATLTVHHYIEGTDDKTVIADQITEVEVGAEYNTSPIEKEGYTFVLSSNNTKGIMKDGGIEVTYYYKRDKFRISDYYSIRKLYTAISIATGAEEATVKRDIENTIEKLETGEIKELTYELFGADILEEDTYPIKAAHAIATYENIYNDKDFVVKGTPGKIYYIGNDTVNSNTFWLTSGTSIDWQGANFIFDDGSFDATIPSENERLRQYFLQVSSKMTIKSGKTSLDLNEKAISRMDFKLNKQSTKLENLADFIKNIINTDTSYYKDTNNIQLAVINEELQEAEKYMVIVYNDNERINIRDGIDYYPTDSSVGNPQQDRFLMDKEGNILNDIITDFNEVTRIRIFPVYEEDMFIKNGNFLTKTNNQVKDSNGKLYGLINRGITAKGVPNLKISNIKHEIDEETYAGTDDTQENGLANGYLAFLTLNYCTNGEIKDSNFSSHSVPDGAGVYDVLISNSLNINLNNIGYVKRDNQTDEEAYYENIINRTTRWSTIIMNYTKNLSATNVKLNSFSCHDSMYNLSIKDSIVGARGLILAGGGYFNVENVKIDNARNILRFHYDLDSSWDGEVNIKGVEFIIPKLQGNVYLVSTVRYEDKYFGVKPYFPSINMENIEIDDSQLVNETSKIYLIGYNEDILEVVDSPRETYYWGDKIIVNNMNINTDSTISNRVLNIFTSKFFKDGRLNQSNYRNDETKEKTNIILRNVALDSKEDISKYNIEGSQFEVIKILNGDIDKDGEVTAYDAYKSLEFSLEESVEKEVLYWIDMDDDEFITAFDAYTILKKSIGL